MRIVAVADTHTFEDDLGSLPEGDLFIHAGDLVRQGTLDELGSVAAWIRSLPHRHKVVVAGNHDWCFVREREQACALLGPDVIYLQDQGITIDGIQLWGSPWQPAYHNWAFNLPRGPALAAKWEHIPASVDILITHGPPHGMGDHSSVGGRGGCTDLLAAVQRARPALHLFGHIHEDGGLWERDGICFANVTTWECERAATVLDYDAHTRTVRPIAIPPRAGRASG